MSGKMSPRKNRLLAFVVIASFIVSGLPVFRLDASGKAVVMKMNRTPTSAAIPLFQSPAPTYDKLIQDDSSNNMLRFNSTTGEYLFSRCSDGFTLTGIGTVTKTGCVYKLTHNPLDRRVLASLDTCQKTASASLQYPPGTTFMSLTDRDTSNDPGLTDSLPPQVSIDSPNGGEIIDTGSTFTINWNAQDDVGVTSQDVWISTNGGATFSTVVAGLPGSVNQYDWTAPASIDNQSVRARVIARDAACNTSRDDSDSNFTLWNPPASFTHSAEAPFYLEAGGFNAFIHLCNSSSSTLIAELAFHPPMGDATAGLPAQISLAPSSARKIKVADYLTLGPSGETVEGSIRLRHNGPSDESVMAMIAVDKFGEEQSFTSPFVYAASQQSPQSSMQCSPLFYIGDQTHAYLALQNCRNYPVTVGVKLNYGTGQAATPNGSYYLPEIKLGGQKRVMIDLADFRDELGGAEWGSIAVSAPAQSVAAHTVMKSSVNHLAFSSPFLDPSLSRSTTKVGSALMLDYDSSLKSCVMICNQSAEERVVTASFQTDNGVAIPSQQITLSPGSQRLLELDSRQVLTSGQSAMADVRLNYSGGASDIMAGAVSMSAAESRALSARFREPTASDGRQMVTPFFRMDARTKGVVEISNIGTSSVRAGVSMKFANVNVPEVTSELVSVGAGKTFALDLQEYLDQVPEGVAAEGCLMLLHNGPAGTVTATFTAIGTGNDIGLESGFEGGPAFPTAGMMLFPQEGIIQPGDSTPVVLMTGGATGPFTFGASDGTIEPLPTSDPDVYGVTYTADDEEGGPDMVTITATSPTGSTSIQVEIQKVKLDEIETFNAQNVSTEGRLNPDGVGKFLLTGKKDFPAVPLVVRFRQGDLKVEVTVPVGSESRPRADQLKGTAPSNTQFLGDARVEVLTEDGTQISKKSLCKKNGKDCSAYYSFDPPAPATSLSVPGFNRLGGNLTITAAGGGYRVFRPSDQSKPHVNPNVNIGDIDFEVNTVTEGTPSSINGNVKRAGPEIQSCVVQGKSPCMKITVKNPGGRMQDKVRSVVDLYTLMPGPPPTPETRFPDNGPSIGGTQITIRGQNLDFAKRVTIGGSPVALVLNHTRNTIVVVSAPHVAGPGNDIRLFDIDNQGSTVVPSGDFRYDLTRVMRFGTTAIFFVGPGEGIDLRENSLSLSGPDFTCLRNTGVLLVRPSLIPPGVPTGVSVFQAIMAFECGDCICNIGGTANCPRPGSATFRFSLVNTAMPANTQLMLSGVQIGVSFTFRPADPITGRNENCKAP
ncbi:MAG: IPT/TIG domain-containing protein [Acidobacteriota bacterium]